MKGKLKPADFDIEVEYFITTTDIGRTELSAKLMRKTWSGPVKFSEDTEKELTAKVQNFLELFAAAARLNEQEKK